MSNSREDKQRKLIEHALGLSPEGDALSRLGEAFSATQDPGFDRDSLAEYVAGTANAEQRETVEAAMAIDPAIRAEVDAMLATKAELELAGSYGPTTAAPRNKSSWLTWGGWATATAAAAVAGIALLRTPELDTARVDALTADLARAVASAETANAAKSDLEQRIALSEAERNDLLRQIEAATLASQAQRTELEELRSRPDRPVSPVRTPRSTSDRVVLRDGNKEVVETPNGLALVEPLESVAATATIDQNKIGTRSVEATRGTVRWPAGKSHPDVPEGPLTYDLSAPTLTAIRETKPTFRFAAIPGAERYVVRVYENNTLVSELSGSQTVLSSDQPLPRGKQYRWTLTAISFDGREVTVANAAMFSASFRILSDSEETELAQRLANETSLLKQIGIYAEYGLVDEAIAACDRLIAGDPRSKLAKDLKKRLLKQRANLREKI